MCERDDGESHGELQAENQRLRQALARGEARLRELEARCVEVERRNGDLTHLYVASYRLHATLRREAVLEAIQEIIASLVGSEEFAVFELDGARQRLKLLSSVGVESERYREVELGSGLIGRTAVDGASYFRREIDDGAAGDEPRLLACIPLSVEDDIVGVIAIFRLLSHKLELSRLDEKLLSLLGSHAASALYYSRLHSGAAR